MLTFISTTQEKVNSTIWRGMNNLRLILLSSRYPEQAMLGFPRSPFRHRARERSTSMASAQFQPQESDPPVTQEHEYNRSVISFSLSFHTYKMLFQTDNNMVLFFYKY